MNRNLSLCLAASLFLAVFSFFPVHAQSNSTVHITPQGNVEPSTAPIQKVGNTFRLTQNLTKPLIVEMDNIVLDGAGYSLIGSGNSSGDALTLLSANVVVEDVQAVNWTTGIVGSEGNNTLAGNFVADCLYGVRIHANDYVVVGNVVANNSEGIKLAANQTLFTKNNVTGNMVGLLIYYENHTVIQNNFDNKNQDIYCQWAGTQTVYHNNFLGNATHVYDGTRYEPADNPKAPATPVNATWDNGEEGNFWSDYNGTDADGNGIGDSPYLVETTHFFNGTGEVYPKNGNDTYEWSEGKKATDNYPLMTPLNITYVKETLQPAATPTPPPTPTPTPTAAPTPSPLPTEQPTPTPTPPSKPPPSWLLILIAFGSVALVFVVISAALKLRHSFR